MAPKGDPRAASERLEKGIERYGEGDLMSAAVEFEEALRLAPEHARAKHYLSWVKDVMAGTRGNGKKKDLDEDAVRAVTEALDADSDGPDEAPWDPVPLTPSPPRTLPPGTGMPTIPYGVEQAMGPHQNALPHAQTEWALPAQALSQLTPIIPHTVKTPSQPKIPAVEPPPSAGTPDTGRTMLGIAPPREGILTPVPRSAVDERLESVTREFSRGTPTLQNVPPLDVPELTEEQVAELISLESTLPTTGPGGRSLVPDLATTPDLPTESKPLIEFEAEATPEPHRASFLLREPRQGDTIREGDLSPLPFASEFDPMELTPTRARQGLEQPVVNPLPVDEPADVQPDEEDATQNPTNPFVRSKLATYAYPPGMEADGEDDLPPQPTGRTGQPIPSLADILGQAKRLLADNEAGKALDVSDQAVTTSGGVDADPCLPYLSLLEKIYEAVIGSLERVPSHGGSVPDLDPRAAFLLSRIDGSMSVDDLLEVSGMPRLEAMRVLALLIRHGAVVTQ